MRLQRIDIERLFSFSDVKVELGDVNVLIGANGAGKSNLVACLEMLSFLGTEGFASFATSRGGAASVLHGGLKATRQGRLMTLFEDDEETFNYGVALGAGPGGVLIIDYEAIGRTSPAGDIPLDSVKGGLPESQLPRAGERGNLLAASLQGYLRQIHVYHFDDTSQSALIRQPVYVEDTRHLRRDGHNLAAYLHRLQVKTPAVYERIVSTICQVAPFFDAFVLEESQLQDRKIILNWKQQGSDMLFGPHQLSDGTLRTMALITVLLQPRNELPGVLVIDEPELGLHPYAIELISDLIRETAHHCQILVATQSTRFVDCFTPEEVLVAARVNGASEVHRLDERDLKDWLDDYTLSELWEKNVLGGRPTR